MLSIIFGACQQSFLKDNPHVSVEQNSRLKKINLAVTFLDLALLVTCIVVGALHAQLGFAIPPTVQWTLIEIGIGGIAMLSYKKVLPSSKEDNLTSV